MVVKVPWQKKDEWTIYGIKNRYNKRTSSNLENSANKIERSWYNKGVREDWKRDFTFKKGIIRGKWNNKTDWITFGKSNGYEKLLPSSLLKCKDKIKRSWYQKGAAEGWLEEFQFSRFRRQKGYYENWKNVKKDLSDAISRNNGFIPSFRKFKEMNFYSLSMKIHTQYGGLASICEKIGYNETKRDELAQELEQIIGEI